MSNHHSMIELTQSSVNDDNDPCLIDGDVATRYTLLSANYPH